MKSKLQVAILLIFFLLTSCTGGMSALSQLESGGETPLPAWTHSATADTKPTKTRKPTSTQTATTTATRTPLPPTITPTPWALNPFNSDLLYPGVEPASYIEDTCAYLENRWGEGKSEPGTIVVPIMFHSILEPGREITDASQITREGFEYLMKQAKELGFETVTMSELLGFLEENRAIPTRSMILILDDRRPDTPNLFMPYLEENDWTLTLGWPTTDATGGDLWAKMENLAESGRIDVQSHGHDHIYIQEFTPVEEIEEEIYKPIDVIEAHFGTKPIAIIWPGGNFTQQATDMAREAGLMLGFTVYPRGPLMFNWIPLGEAERGINDPLMVLPRYWSIEAFRALEVAVEISEAAQAAAEEAKEEEQLFYSLFCQP